MGWWVELLRPGWLSGVEHEFGAAYHWSRSEIRSLTVWEYFEHKILIRQERSRDLSWQFAIADAANPEASDDFRQLIQTEISLIGKFGRKRKTGFDIVADRGTTLLIGQMLHLHGDKFADAHPDRMKWLEGRNLTRDQAVEMFLSWREEMNENPFWQYNRRKRETNDVDSDAQ